MKRSIILLFVVLGTLFFGYVLVGCSQEKQYIIEIKCDDNTTVNNISICIEMKEEYARKTAERFARSWERKDFNEMYTFMIPELKDIKNETDFVLTMKYLEGNDSIVIRLDEVLEDTENVSYVYYTVTSSIFEAKAPAMRMEYENGKWKINA
ncbi:hypothetical protein HQ545_03050, partial [Candidatus Woesearchaeota archaeon]|nr:hypothetical protein [Candidatus Woesearchaeota archaeon]